MSFFGAIWNAIPNIVNPLGEQSRRAREQAAANLEVLPEKQVRPEQLHAIYVESLVFEVKLRCIQMKLNTEMMRAIFDKFAEGDGDQQRHWSQTSLTNYLDAILPPSTPNVRALWAPCVPMLHRLLHRLGNFPFHVDPIIPLITYDVFRCAVIHINYREHELADITYIRPNISFRDLDALFRKLLFQSLMTLSSNGAARVPERTRTKEDDEYMLGVLRKAKAYNVYWLLDRLHDGQKLPTPDILPCTWSTEVSGSISQRGLEGLIKLFLALQLSPEKIGPEAFDDYSTSLDNIAKGMALTFRVPGQTSDTPDILWKGFDSALRDELPNLLFSLDRIFRPVVKQRMLIDNMDAFRSADISTTTSIFQAMFASPRNINMPPRGHIIDLSLLAQLSTFLPTNIRLAKFEVDPIPICDLTAACLHKKVEAAISSPTLLLVSGMVEDKTGNALSPIIVGLFLPPYSTFSQQPPDLSRSASQPPTTKMMFQLQPQHRVLRPCGKYPALNFTIPSLNVPSKDQELTLSFRIDDERLLQTGLKVRGDGKAEYWVDSQGIPGKDTPQEAGVSQMKSEKHAHAALFRTFNMNALEVLRF